MFRVHDERWHLSLDTSVFTCGTQRVKADVVIEIAAITVKGSSIGSDGNLNLTPSVNHNRIFFLNYDYQLHPGRTLLVAVNFKEQGVYSKQNEPFVAYVSSSMSIPANFRDSES